MNEFPTAKQVLEAITGDTQAFSGFDVTVIEASNGLNGPTYNVLFKSVTEPTT